VYFQKLHEEIDELQEAIKLGDSQAIEEELGDILFTQVNLCRFLKYDAEITLGKANNKFMKRLAFIESLIKSQGLEYDTLSDSERDVLWNASKE